MELQQEQFGGNQGKYHLNFLRQPSEATDTCSDVFIRPMYLSTYSQAAAACSYTSEAVDGGRIMLGEEAMGRLVSIDWH